MNQQNRRRAPGKGDGGKIPNRVVGYILQQRNDPQGYACKQQSISVRRRFRDSFYRNDRDSIFNYHRLDERTGKPLRNDASGEIGSASGSRSKHAYWLGWIALAGYHSGAG